MKGMKMKTRLAALLLLTGVNAHSMVMPVANAPANGQQPMKKHSIKTECHATEAVIGHDGKVVKWQAHCHVDVFAGKDQPIFDDLSPENMLRNAQFRPTDPQFQNNNFPLPNQYAAPMAAPRPSMAEILQNIQFLVDEARLRHHECMSSKESIMGQLQNALPPGLTQRNDILAAINSVDVNLAPNVGLYVGHLDEKMRQKVAELHAIQNNPSLSEDQKKEAMKGVKSEIQAHLDQHCQDAHPSIKHFGISSVPPSNLGSMKVALLVNQPDGQVRTIDLPQSSGYSQDHVDVLKSMAEAAAHHSRTTGQVGNFNVYRHVGPDPAQEQALRQLAYQNYYNNYGHFVMPSMFVVDPAGGNRVYEGFQPPAQQPPASAPNAQPVSSNMIDAVASAPAASVSGGASTTSASSATKTVQVLPGSAPVVVNSGQAASNQALNQYNAQPEAPKSGSANVNEKVINGGSKPETQNVAAPVTAPPKMSKAEYQKLNAKTVKYILTVRPGETELTAKERQLSELRVKARGYGLEMGTDLINQFFDQLIAPYNTAWKQFSSVFVSPYPATKKAIEDINAARQREIDSLRQDLGVTA